MRFRGNDATVVADAGVNGAASYGAVAIVADTGSVRTKVAQFKRTLL